MYVYVCVCVCVCLYVSLSLSLYIYIYIYIYLHISHTQTDTGGLVPPRARPPEPLWRKTQHKYIYIYIYIYVHIIVYLYQYIYIYICIYIYMYIHIHVYMYTHRTENRGVPPNENNSTNKPNPIHTQNNHIEHDANKQPTTHINHRIGAPIAQSCRSDAGNPRRTRRRAGPGAAPPQRARPARPADAVT